MFQNANVCVYYIWNAHIFLLQDALILYAKLQLNLTRGGADGSSLVEQVLDVVCKDLDQSNISSTGVPWWVFYSLSDLLLFCQVIIAGVFWYALIDVYNLCSGVMQLRMISLGLWVVHSVVWWNLQLLYFFGWLFHTLCTLYLLFYFFMLFDLLWFICIVDLLVDLKAT